SSDEVVESIEEDLKALVGDVNADAKFDCVISAPATYKAGDSITVTVTIDNITAADGLDMVKFLFNYDNTKLTITNDIDEKDNGNLKCLDLSGLADTAWENFTIVNSNFKDLTTADLKNGVQAVADNDGLIDASALTTTLVFDSVGNGDLVFEFTFDVAEDATGEIGLYIAHNDIMGGLNVDTGLESYAGNGGYVIISEFVEEGDDSSDVVEESSDVVEESSDVVEESSDVVEESSDVVEESSDVVEESSDVVEESSDVVEDSSDVVEESSDVVEESSDVVDEPTVEPENIAFNKEYSTHDPRGGYNANLTDGVKHSAMAYSGDHWFAFMSNPTSGVGNLDGSRTASVIINLEGSYDIASVVINAIQNTGSGIPLPKSVQVFLSDDGATWGDAIDLDIPTDTSVNTAFEIAGDVVGTASFVKVEVTLGDGGTFAFINEIEVYGVAAEADDDESSDVVEDSSDVVEDSSDVVEDSSDVVEDSSDVVEDSSDVVEDSSDVVEDSSDVVEDSSDVVEDSSDVVEDSSDVVEDSSDVVEDSSDVVEDSSDVVEDSSDVVEDSSDDTSDDSSDDTSDDSSDDTSDDPVDPDPEDPVDPDPTIAYGDVNGDGEVNVIDYALVKRAAFGTYDLSEDEYVRANVYADDVIDSTDYLLVKRIAFGTYDPYAEPTPAE
ncbi:MAG: hypothetical protein J6Q89_04805, partial [Clostridia bacterium]|nr:hypothetical protein [Clostridia bacterium]